MHRRNFLQMLPAVLAGVLLPKKEPPLDAEIEDGSYICNCYIRHRKGDDCIIFGKDRARIHLDGYAIVPLEEYETQIPL